MLLLRSVNELRRVPCVLGMTVYVMGYAPMIRIKEGWVPYVGGTRLLDGSGLRLISIRVVSERPRRACSIKYTLAAWKSRNDWAEEEIRDGL